MGSSGGGGRRGGGSTKHTYPSSPIGVRINSLIRFSLSSMDPSQHSRGALVYYMYHKKSALSPY